MEVTPVVLLIGAGLAGGFIAGLLGVGGGIIFAPVLFFYFQAIGVDALVLTPLTLGTSLFCTLIASLISGWFHYRQGSVCPRVALSVGAVSAATTLLVTRFVTTQPWYDGRVFQFVFSLVLLVVVARMIQTSRAARSAPAAPPDRPPHWSLLISTGIAAGTVSPAAGVGGGVVLVPAYANLLRVPMQAAVGTSSATIVLIALAGTLTYTLLGLGSLVPATAVGFVDYGHALALCLPAVATARGGVWASHRIPTRILRISFAVLAAFVAIRLLIRAVAA